MATLSVSDLRQRIAAAVEALASPDAWHQSSWSYDVFPTAEPGTYLHLSFAVGAPRTEFASQAESVRHKRGSDGGAVTTTIGIRWVHRHLADDSVDDYDGALDAEAALLVGVTGAASTDVHVSVLEMSRSLIADGTWILGEMVLSCDHRIAIQ
jgi:hypothetical protein